MPIVSPPIAPEETRAAGDLHLGDVITRDPDTGTPVRWHLLSDGTTHKGGRRVWFLAATSGLWDGQRRVSFGRDELLRAEVCPDADRGRYHRPTTESEAS